MNSSDSQFLLTPWVTDWTQVESFATVSSLEAEPVLENLTIITVYHYNLKIMAYFKKKLICRFVAFKLASKQSMAGYGQSKIFFWPPVCSHVLWFYAVL